MINVKLAHAKRTEPTIPVGHPKFIWYGAAATDVQRTWRRFGWKPVNVKKQGDDNVRRA